MKNFAKKQFNHLKIHTQYSICEGAIKISNFSNHCKENKIKSAAITDSNNLFGVLDFSESLTKVGTQPIVGLLLNIKHDDIYGKVTLFAKTLEGYKNLISLSSKSYLDIKKDEIPHCTIDDLNKYSSGIIILSGCVDGFFGNLFKKNKVSHIENIFQSLQKNFKDNFYLEIQRHNDQDEKIFENFLLKTSSELKIPIIATHEVFYIEQNMHEAHDALICIGEKTYVNEKNRKKFSNQHYLKSSEEMFKIFSDLPEALENNINLPIRCSFKPKKSLPVLPEIHSISNNSISEELKEKATKGLKQKMNDFVLSGLDENETKKTDKIYKDRLSHELKIITDMNYSGYFLIVSDYVDWAKKQGIPVGPGRGSGAGSLVAWCLSITDLDPIKFGLIFERFLNPDRVSMPDFDIDFCEEKRDKVFEYLKQKYGRGVAHIITFGKLKARMVLRDVGRVIGLPYGYVDKLCKMIPFDPSRPVDLKESIAREPRLQSEEKNDERVKKLIELSLKLEGLNRNVATHAAGVVIAEKNLSQLVPLYKDLSLDLLLPATQFDMYSAENAGLIKFDLLGLKTLTIIQKTIKFLSEKKIDIDINKIKLDDKKVFDLLSSGKTVGLFQLESSGMRDALIQMKPNKFEDIIALVALFRPGPMENIATYNACKHGKKEPEYLHPKLEKILEPTYGVIIYQEQVMQIAQTLSGFTAGQADILRRAMGKKKRIELEKQKEAFINGAVNNKISKDVASFIFKKIEPFAEYGFNKSHAAAYAMIAYQTAFLKTYYPNEFVAACMTYSISNTDTLSEFYEELKRININIEVPNINKCFKDFYPEDNKMYYALGAIKSVGKEAIGQIVSERENGGQFKSIEDFIKRVNPKNMNKLQLEGLVKAGAFDCLEKNRKRLFISIPKILQQSKDIYENKILNQKSLFSDDSMEGQNQYLLKEIEDWPVKERLSKEFEAVGFFISDHPLKNYSNIINFYNVQTFEEFQNSKISEAVIAGTIMKFQEKKTSKGTAFAIVKFSDERSTYELFLFSEILNTNRSDLQEGTSFLITLTKNDSESNNRFRRVIVKKVVNLEKILKDKFETINIELSSYKNFEKLSKIIEKKGETLVKIKIRDNKCEYNFKLNERRHFDFELFSKLKKYDNIKKITI